MASHPTVPLARGIILGTKGSDVIAAKRALSRAGYIKWGQFTDVWGEFAVQACHAFQKDHGLKPAGYGEKTHAKLLATHAKGSRVDWAWDSYSVGLMHAEYILIHTTPEQRIRTKIISAARNLYAHRASISYSQRRPTQLYSLGGTVPTQLDCSGFCTNCHHAGGARNPNIYAGERLPYNGEGYTGTLMAGGRQTTRDKLKPGDFVFYGFTQHSSGAFPYGSPTHVAIWVGDGTVYSMGHYPMGHYAYYYGMPINCYVTYNVVP